MRRRIVVAGIVLAGLVTAGAGGQEPFPDAIVRWEPIAENPLFEAAGGDAWDAKIRERGWILFDEGRYRMWYTGYNVDRMPPTRSLGHATSADGIRWERDPRNPIHDEVWVEDMMVLRHEGRYLMFAEGEGDIAHWLTSDDGIAWERRGPLDVRLADGSPIPPGPYGTPTVLHRDGIWHLFYERRDQGVWLATSEDLEVWTNVRDEPVIDLGPEPYDSTAVALNQVVERDGVVYAVYHANAHRPWRDWTTCVARSVDLVHWEKYAGNPIVEDNASSGILVDGPDGTFLYTMHPDVRRYVLPDDEGPGREAPAPFGGESP